MSKLSRALATLSLLAVILSAAVSCSKKSDDPVTPDVMPAINAKCGSNTCV